KPERTLNRRLRQRNRRVPFEQRNNPPQHPRIVYPPILDINYFRHFLDILRNLNPMDDEPMWAADHVVSPTLGSAITIPETANEFAIKDTKNEAVRLMMFPLSLTGEAKTWLDEINEGTIKTEILAFSQIENESLTDAWLRMKEMLINYHGHNLSKGNIIKIFYHSLNEITQEVLNVTSGGIFLYKTPNQAYQLLEDKVLLKIDWAKNQKTKSSLKKTIAFTAEAISSKLNTLLTLLSKIPLWISKANLKQQQKITRHQSKAKFDRFNDKQSGRPSRSLPSNTQPNPKGSSSKPYQRNEHVNTIFTRSGKSYDPPDYPNNQQNDFETPINFDCDDKDDKPIPQPKPKRPKPVKETPKSNLTNQKSHILNASEENMEAQYGNFLDMIRAV
nr:hypothetical protein [Tanacetum cinerariifolium]